MLTGEVRIQGGSADADIDRIELSLVTRAEAEHGGVEAQGVAEFLRLMVADRVRVTANQRRDVPFQLVLPWETPITSIGSAALPGMTTGVRTELVISGAGQGRPRPGRCAPAALTGRGAGRVRELRFRFRGADVEVGRLHGVPQELGFYQEIEFFPPPEVAGRVNEVELTFVATPYELYVILEADKRGGFLSAGGDSFGRFAMAHADAEQADWASLIGGWLAETLDRRPSHNSAFSGQPVYGQPRYGHGYEHEHGHRERRGPGMGAIIGGAAAGAIGGMIIGDMIGDAFEDDGGEDGGEE